MGIWTEGRIAITNYRGGLETDHFVDWEEVLRFVAHRIDDIELLGEILAEIKIEREDENLRCPGDVLTATDHFEPAGPGGGGEDADPFCAGCGIRRSKHKTDI